MDLFVVWLLSWAVGFRTKERKAGMQESGGLCCRHHPLCKLWSSSPAPPVPALKSSLGSAILPFHRSLHDEGTFWVQRWQAIWAHILGFYCCSQALHCPQHLLALQTARGAVRAAAWAVVPLPTFNQAVPPQG